MFNFLWAMFKRFPGLFILNISLLLVSAGLETLTLLTLVPVADLFSLPNLNAAGPVTRHFMTAFGRVGLSPTLIHMMVVLLLFQVLSSTLSIVAALSLIHI